jgi:hypothetical protein
MREMLRNGEQIKEAYRENYQLSMDTILSSLTEFLRVPRFNDRFRNYKGILAEMFWNIGFFEIMNESNRKKMEHGYIAFFAVVTAAGPHWMLDFMKDNASKQMTKDSMNIILDHAQGTGTSVPETNVRDASKRFLTHVFGGWDKPTVYAQMGWEQT